MRNLLFVAILANMLIISLGQRSPNGQNLCPDAYKRFTDALLRNSMGFLRSYAEARPDKTGSVSAYGMLAIAASLAVFADEESQTQIFTLLDVRSRDEIICLADVTKYPVSRLPDCIELGISVGLYGDNKYQFTPNFIGNVSDIIVGTVKNFDFSNADETANAINAIVANQTYNRIPNIIKNSSIFNSSTQLVSVNFLSIKSEWEIEFQTTEELQFRISPNESAPQEFLYQDAVYLYGHSEILGATVVQVNFCCGSNFYVWVIVPDRLFTVDDLIDKLNQNTEWYYELKQVMEPTRLDLYIMRYVKSTTADSKALFLDATNITSIYNADMLNLKGAIKNEKPAALSVSLQETYASLSTEGGAVPNGPLSNGTKKTFKSNSPHVSIIFREAEVYLTGVIRRPVS